MPDLKTNYDRLLLAFAGLLAAGTSILIAFSAISSRDEAIMPVEEIRQEPFVSDPVVDTLKSDRETQAARKQWSASDASPFVSRVYLLKDDRLVDILESGNDLFPGISNAWIMEHELDYLDLALPDADPDTDGFTNFEEFSAKTNPRDTSSKPAPWIKLRLIEASIEKLRFKFMSLPRGTLDAVSINTVSADNPSELSGSTQFYPRPSETVKTADGEKNADPRLILLAGKSPDGESVFELTPFRFERAEMRKRFNTATSRDEQVPVAIIKNTADGKLLDLEQGKVEDSPYAKATLLDTRTQGQKIFAQVGSIFDMGTAARYKLVDVSEENATIEDLGSGEKHVIPKAAMPAPQAAPEKEQTQ